MNERKQLKLVKGFEDVMDYYFVCREGDKCWVIGRGGKVLNGSFDKDGYRTLGLHLNSGKIQGFRQHRIFMLVFIPNPENKSQVNHLDSNKSNNLLSNLEWVTPSENGLYAFKVGESKLLFGDQARNVKLKDSQIPLIFEMRKTGKTQQYIANNFGISRSHISSILSGRYRSQSSPILTQPQSLLSF